MYEKACEVYSLVATGFYMLANIWLISGGILLYSCIVKITIQLQATQKCKGEKACDIEKALSSVSQVLTGISPFYILTVSMIQVCYMYVCVYVCIDTIYILAYGSWPLFLFFPRFDVISDLLLNRQGLSVIYLPVLNMAVFLFLCQWYNYFLQVASGAGLTFIAFTEAIVQMPAPHVWAILFFMMLITLGFGSMFGTMEGLVTPLFDSKIFNVKKPYITGKV